MAFGELRFDGDVNGRMQLRTSDVVLRLLVVPSYGGEAVCFRGSQPLNGVRCDLWVIAHFGFYRSPFNAAIHLRLTERPKGASVTGPK